MRNFFKKRWLFINKWFQVYMRRSFQRSGFWQKIHHDANGVAVRRTCHCFGVHLHQNRHCNLVSQDSRRSWKLSGPANIQVKEKGKKRDSSSLINNIPEIACTAESRISVLLSVVCKPANEVKYRLNKKDTWSRNVHIELS